MSMYKYETNTQHTIPRVKESKRFWHLIRKGFITITLSHTTHICANKTKIAKLTDKVDDHFTCETMQRGGDDFVYLYLRPLLPHKLSGCVTPALILKANWPLTVGTWYNFLFLRGGKTPATLSFLIAYEAIKSHQGLSFSARRVITCWPTHQPLRYSEAVKISVNLREEGCDWTPRGQTSLFPGNHR